MKLKLRLFFMIVIAFTFANTSNATTYTAVKNGQWDSLSTWDANGVPDNLGTADVVIPDGDTVTISANFTINNLTIGGGSSGCLQYSKTYGATTVVNGNILVQAGATFKVQTNTLGVASPNGGLAHSLDLKGNLTDNGSSLDFRSGTAGTTLSVCNLTLSGTTNSTLSINTSYSSSNGDFNGVTINKTGGAKVILGSNIAVSGGSSTGPAICNAIMTFVSGIIETGSYIWICQTSTAASVLGYSPASYVIGAMGRGMSNSVGSSKDFPVGDANGYELFTLRSTTSGAATGHYAIVRCVPGNANTGSSSLLGGIDKVSQVRYYQVSYNQLLGSGATSMNFDRFWVSYTYDDGVAQGNTNLRVAYSTNTRATWNGMNQLTNPHTTKHSVTPPTQIKPDSLGTPVTLNSGSNSIYFALARVTGTTENTLTTSVVLHPTVFLEGVTNAGGTAMRNDFWPITVTAELHDGSTLALVEAQTGVLSTAGVSYLTFSTAVNDIPYYIVIKSANTVETWSATPQSFVSSYLTYNFSTAAEKAYGSNMIQKGSGAWCIFSGDVSKDGTNIVDGSDVIAIDNDNTYSVTTSAVTDITGDGIVDGSDVINVDNNNTYSISRQAPPGAPVARRVIRPGITQKQNIK
jgi:hypothetical protein